MHGVDLVASEADAESSVSFLAGFAGAATTQGAAGVPTEEACLGRMEAAAEADVGAVA